MGKPIRDALSALANDPIILQAHINDLVADSDFRHIGEKLTSFNFFEAIGAQRREVRHSDFLAFLLNPRGNHGLGDAFLRRFLKQSLETSFNYPGPSNFQIERETRNVDIFLHDDKNRLAVIIENKIDSDEHDNQLERYWDESVDIYPGFQMFGVYLTPEGEKPEGSNHYSPFSYSSVANLIEEILGDEKITRSPAVELALRHYVEMLRRDIVPGSELQQLCEAVYFKHRDVLDKIFEFKPDLQVILREYVKGLIGTETQKFVIDPNKDKDHIRFAAREWDSIEQLKEDHDSWGRILWFQFYNVPDSLKLRLIIGPGDRNVRQKLLDVALENNTVLKATDRSLGTYWNSIYSRPILSKSFLADPRMSEVEEMVKKERKQFLESDLPNILGLIRSIKWENTVQPD
jgi:hypothetical protein